jgi:hypothetical protein
MENIVPMSQKPWEKFGLQSATYYRAVRAGRDPAKVVPRGTSCRDPYKTFDHASRAVQVLGIKTKDQYRSVRRENKRLPSRPDRVYKNFKQKGGWGKFLGTGRSRRLLKDCYPTWQDAAKAAKVLNCSNTIEYRSVWRQDPKLPRNPDEVYKNFPRLANTRPDWGKFFHGV